MFGSLTGRQPIGRDERLPRVQRHRLEFVQFADPLDDLPDRRIGRHPLRDLLQRLPRLHLHHRQASRHRAALPTTPPN